MDSKSKGAEKVECQGQAGSLKPLPKQALCATARGLRGVRVGETDHPGPVSLRVLTFNVGSLHRHWEEVLRVAKQQGAQVLVLQETGITKTQAPGFCHRAKRDGWNANLVPACSVPGGGRGGLAVLTLEPLNAIVLRSSAQAAGQLLTVQLHGTMDSWVIHCGYRRPGMDDDQILLELAANLEIVQHRHWLFACDWNESPTDSAMGRIVSSIGGHIVATSGHRSSSRPTDSVWVGGGTEAAATGLPMISDHTGNLVQISQAWLSPAPPSWRFRTVNPVRKDVRPEEWGENGQTWLQSATPDKEWQDLLHTKDVEGMWNVWSRDAESYLVNQGVPSQVQGTCPRGKEPSLVPGCAPTAPSQSVQERQVRRFLRRLDEIKAKTDRGAQVPPGLLYNVSRDARRWGLHHEADVGAWGRCRTVANAKLQALLKTKADEAVKTWKARVKTLPGACKWAKAKAPPPWVISFTERRMGEDHCQVAAGQAAGRPCFGKLGSRCFAVLKATVRTITRTFSATRISWPPQASNGISPSLVVVT